MHDFGKWVFQHDRPTEESFNIHSDDNELYVDQGVQDDMKNEPTYHSQNLNPWMVKGSQFFSRASYDSALNFFLKAKRQFETERSYEQLYNASQLSESLISKNG